MSGIEGGDVGEPGQGDGSEAGGFMDDDAAALEAERERGVGVGDESRSRRLSPGTKMVMEFVPPPAPPKPKNGAGKRPDEYERAKTQEQGDQRRRTATFAETGGWWLKRVGPKRDDAGKPVQCGLYPEMMTGPIGPDTIGAVAGGGDYVTTTDDPKSPAARWSDPIPVLGPPKKIGVVEQPGGPPAFMPDSFFGGPQGGFADEWVDVFDADRGRWIKTQRRDAEIRNAPAVPPEVKAALEAAKATSEAALKAVSELAATMKASLERKPDDREDKWLAMERERNATERERIKAEAAAKDSDLKFLREKMDRDVVEADKRRAADLEKAREERKAAEVKADADRKALEAKLDKQAEEAAKAQERYHEMMLQRSEEKGNPLSGVGEALKALAEFKDRAAGIISGKEEDDEDEKEKPSLVGSIVEFARAGAKALPDIQAGLAALARQQAAQQAPQQVVVQQLPAPQQPAAPAAEQAPTQQPPAQPDQAAAPAADNPLAQYDALVREITSGMDRTRPPAETWAAIRQKLTPDVVAQLQASAAGGTAALVNDIRFMSTVPGFEELRPGLDRLVKAAGGAHQKWAEQFVLAIQQAK